MVIELLALYACVAVLSAVICCYIRNQWGWEMLVSNSMLGAVTAWVGGTLFGAIGPVVYGTPVLACFGVTLPTLFGFNAIFAPSPVGRSSKTSTVIDVGTKTAISDAA